MPRVAQLAAAQPRDIARGGADRDVGQPTDVGLAGVRDAVNAELTELGNAILALSQGYSANGASNGSGSVDGSQAIDTPQTINGSFSTPPAIPSVIDVPASN